MSVSTMLASYTSEAALFDTSTGWRQFIVDHKQVIRDQGDLWSTTSELMQQVGQDVHALLRHIGGGIDTRLYWIFMIINDIGSVMEFTDARIVYVPKMTSVTNLYATYQTAGA